MDSELRDEKCMLGGQTMRNQEEHPWINYVSCPSGSAMKHKLSTFCQLIKGKISEKIILREFVIE